MIQKIDYASIPGDIVSGRFKQMIGAINNNFTTTINNTVNSYYDIDAVLADTSGNIPKLLFLESTGRQYRYIEDGGIYTVNGDSILETPNGGNTRYIPLLIDTVSVDISGKEDVSNKSNSIVTDASSTTKYPSVKAIKDYADGLVFGLLDDRGSHDASSGVFPSTGGSGVAGAILKGDLWFISVEGTLGGTLVPYGGSIRAMSDNPGQTAGNWDLIGTPIGFIPENVSNKETASLTNSTTKYPASSLVVSGLAGKVDKSVGYSLIADLDVTRLSNTSGTNTGDQDLSGKEDSSNKETVSLTNSTTKYPSSGLMVSELAKKVDKSVGYMHQSTGVYVYGGAAKQSTSTFSVGVTRGWVVKNTGANATNPVIKEVVYAGGSGLTVDSYTGPSTYLYLNEDGVLLQKNTALTLSERRSNILLARIAHPDNATILNVRNIVDYSNSPMSTIRDMFSNMNLINNRIIVSANGANLCINTSFGTLCGLGINYSVDDTNPNSYSVSAKVQAAFSYRTMYGGSTPPVIYIDPTKYDNGGVITTIPVDGKSKRSSNQRIFMYADGVINIQYGQSYYADIATAVSNVQTETFYEYQSCKEQAIQIGVLCVSIGCTSLNSIDTAVFIPVSKFGEAIGGSVGISTTSLQQAYNNSVTPEITTDSALGALSVKCGSSLDSDVVFEVLNKAGVVTASINGNGVLTANNISGTNTGDQDISGKEDVSNKSNSIVTDASSTTKYPSVKAIKDYADGLVVGLLDDRGSFDASAGTFPTTGGSGVAGAILKGDLWFISVEGTLGGTLVPYGGSIRAMSDNPGQTAGNWDLIGTPIGFIPENVSNKETASLTNSTTKYPASSLMVSELSGKVPTTRTVNGKSLSSDVTLKISESPDFINDGTTTTVLHGNASGQLSFHPVDEYDISLSAITVNNATTGRHGFLPALSGNSTQFLNGEGNYTTPSGITNSYLSLSYNSQTSVNVVHAFGTYPIVQTINSSGVIFNPTSITHNTLNDFTVVFSGSSTGTIIASVGSPQPNSLSVITGNYNISVNDHLLCVTSAGVTLTLPTAVGNTSREFHIKNASVGNIFVNTTSSQTIDSVLIQQLSSGESFSVFSDGSNYFYF